MVVLSNLSVNASLFSGAKARGFQRTVYKVVLLLNNRFRPIGVDGY